MMLLRFMPSFSGINVPFSVMKKTVRGLDRCVALACDAVDRPVETDRSGSLRVEPGKLDASVFEDDVPEVEEASVSPA